MYTCISILDKQSSVLVNVCSCCRMCLLYVRESQFPASDAMSSITTSLLGKPYYAALSACHWCSVCVCVCVCGSFLCLVFFPVRVLVKDFGSTEKVR